MEHLQLTKQCHGGSDLRLQGLCIGKNRYLLNPCLALGFRATLPKENWCVIWEVLLGSWLLFKEQMVAVPRRIFMQLYVVYCLHAFLDGEAIWTVTHVWAISYIITASEWSLWNLLSTVYLKDLFLVTIYCFLLLHVLGFKTCHLYWSFKNMLATQNYFTTISTSVNK